MTPQELYQVYNMGTRLEVYLDAAHADTVLAIARQFDIDAQVIGRITTGVSGVEVRTAKGEQLWYPA